MADRGMKKWAPYKSLIEQTDSLRELDNSFKVDEKPLISEDQEEEINELLVNYHGQEVHAKYYKNRKIREVTGIIKKIDPNNRMLIFDEVKITFEELFYLKNSN